MAFFDDLGKKFTEASQGALSKTKDLADLAKFNSNISEEERKITSKYTEIGKLYVEKHQHDFEEEFGESIAIIKESQNKIADYQMQIRNIKGVIKCPSCGAEVPQDATFCAGCGTAISRTENEKTYAEACTKVCPNCGEKLADNVLFCTQCGTKVE